MVGVAAPPGSVTATGTSIFGGMRSGMGAGVDGARTGAIAAFGPGTGPIWQCRPGIPTPAPAVSAAGAAVTALAGPAVTGMSSGRHGGSGPGNSSSSRPIVPGPTSPNCVKPSTWSVLNERTAVAVFGPYR